MTECCEGNTRLIYSCSGGSDVGEITDRVARKLRDKCYGKMSCLAGIGARIAGFIESAKSAENITIDGCPVACARKNLEGIGLTPCSFILTEMGLTKGKTPITPEIVDKLTQEIIKELPIKPSSKPNTPKCGCGC